MNAAHESRALSLRALNPLLTPSQRIQGNHYEIVCVGVCRTEIEERARQDKVQHFKLQNMR